MRWPIKSLAALVALSSAGGCGAPPAGRPAILSTPLGPQLGALWKAHGGDAAWRRHAGVRFAYRFDGAGGGVELGEVVFRWTAPDKCWIRRPASDEQTPHAEIDLRSAPGEVWPPAMAATFQDVAAALAADHAVRALRFLFQLPLSLERGDWRIRQLVPPQGLLDEASPQELELAPTRGGEWVGPFLIETAPVLLERAFYMSRHPEAPSAICEVRFEAYRWRQGIAVASRRRHFSTARPAAEAPDPLDLNPPPVPERTPFLVETLEGIRFLGAAELDALLGVATAPDAVDESA